MHLFPIYGIGSIREKSSRSWNFTFTLSHPENKVVAFRQQPDTAALLPSIVRIARNVESLAARSYQPIFDRFGCSNFTRNSIFDVSTYSHPERFIRLSPCLFQGMYAVAVGPYSGARCENRATLWRVRVPAAEKIMSQHYASDSVPSLTESVLLEILYELREGRNTDLSAKPKVILARKINFSS